MSTATNILVTIERNTIQYAFPILLIAANVGNLLFICVFVQKNHRQNPTSLYLLASAIICLLGANWGFATAINAHYQTPDPFTVSLTLCRIRGYILQTTLLLHRSMIILACLDRYALSSSNPRIRSFSNKPLAIKWIIGTIIVGSIITIQQPFFQTIQSNRCGMFGSYGLVYSIYQITILGILLPTAMIVLAILLYKNLRNARFRTMRHQISSIVFSTVILPKRDISLVKFVIAEAVVAFVLNVLYPINTLYGVLTDDVLLKTSERNQTESFLRFLTEHVLLYMNYCVTFYLYMIMSKSFRAEIYHFFLRFRQFPKRFKRDDVLRTVSLRFLRSNSNRVAPSIAQTVV